MKHLNLLTLLAVSFLAGCGGGSSSSGGSDADAKLKEPVPQCVKVEAVNPEKVRLTNVCDFEVFYNIFLASGGFSFSSLKPGQSNLTKPLGADRRLVVCRAPFQPAEGPRGGFCTK